MAADAAAGQGPSAGEYIIHHLTHLQNHKQTKIVDFSVFNLDSIFFAVVLGVVGCFFLWRAASKATSGVPGRFQAGVELLVEMVDAQAKGIVHNATSRKFVAPLALTVFIWIFLMNSMDFLPVDLLPLIADKGAHIHYLRVVPTADLSVTMGLSVTVLLICLYYNVKIKGFGGWVHELFAAPFGDKVFLYPINFLMQLIEFVAKTHVGRARVARAVVTRVIQPHAAADDDGEGQRADQVGRQHGQHAGQIGHGCGGCGRTARSVAGATARSAPAGRRAARSAPPARCPPDSRGGRR